MRYPFCSLGPGRNVSKSVTLSNNYRMTWSHFSLVTSKWSSLAIFSDVVSVSFSGLIDLPPRVMKKKNSTICAYNSEEAPPKTNAQSWIHGLDLAEGAEWKRRGKTFGRRCAILTNQQPLIFPPPPLQVFVLISRILLGYDLTYIYVRENQCLSLKNQKNQKVIYATVVCALLLARKILVKFQAQMAIGALEVGIVQ